MSPKNLALVAAAVAVMAMGVYLFIQVKATPAQAHSTAPTTSASRTSPAPERSTEPPAQVAGERATPSMRAAPEQPAPIQVANTAEPEATSAEESQRANPRLDAMMQLASKAYDTQDFDQATALAGKILSKDPTNVKMLRIMVSANCIAGDAAVAQQHYDKLPKLDRDQMKVRCERYQVTFKDPPE